MTILHSSNPVLKHGATQPNGDSPPHFDLWREPWITLETFEGTLAVLSLRDALLQAHNHRTVYDASPLVIIGIHRLCVAVLQEMYAPKYVKHIAQIWQDGSFSADLITNFEASFGDRFDLFDQDAPFMQSADIPLTPEKWGRGQSAGYLFHEEPPGTTPYFFNHQQEDKISYCPICAAKSLTTLPAFTSAGGAGNKASINGVPPIYIIPTGETYFHSLVSSITTKKFQPDYDEDELDLAWWRRSKPTIVGKRHELIEVGYLHSLTFPVRRVRLHPKSTDGGCCTRCGRQTQYIIPEITFQMGEDRTATSWWRDPFAAYRLAKKEGEHPIAIRPVEGRATWREFGGLFLPHKEKQSGYRPTIIDQLEQDEIRKVRPKGNVQFQVIALRTDMKMKMFEWELSGFTMPPALLSDDNIAQAVEVAIDFAKQCEGVIFRVFGKFFGKNLKQPRHAHLQQLLKQTYWDRLGTPFRQQFILSLTPHNANERKEWWKQWCRDEAQRCFVEITAYIGSDAEALQARVQAESSCYHQLEKLLHPEKYADKPKNKKGVK